jgi:hypothetical protein
MVKEEKVKGLKDKKISLTGIKNGVYFVQLDKSPITKKLVITN